MHNYPTGVRTTVEIPDELRARLLEIAARRGLKGFSGLVEEALVLYLGELERREHLASRARALIGSLSEEEAEALESSVSSARRSWR
jgi:metal-responsive CopG/Arc/MetJ family transcriptional regulator